MSIINLYPQNLNQFTFVPNQFIDNYLWNSNGDFVKVYLFILRCVSKSMNSISSTDIADNLQLTEADVRRALKYWEVNNVMYIEYENDADIVAIKFCSLDNINNNDHVTSKNEVALTSNQLEARVNLTSKPQYEINEMTNFMSQPDYKQLIYITQKYLGKMLTQQDINTLIGFNDWLGLPFEVIELLVEYCVSNNHRNMNYIEKVAINWADEGINTIPKAEHRIQVFNKSYFKIMKNLGIGDRNPTPKQIDYMNKWINDYNLSIEIITEACDRTIETINQPQFSYIDAILKNWNKNNVKTIKDINELDKKHNQKTTNKQSVKTTENQSKFINYDQRTYNFDELEKKAMELLIKETDGRY
ncbi:MAG: DnaD domain protein [Vallitalea sp.]|jgi:DnaD/phage-associated family protein|nr:DnaD domain protein [Vallitalea sp.]